MKTLFALLLIDLILLPSIDAGTSITSLGGFTLTVCK